MRLPTDHTLALLCIAAYAVAMRMLALLQPYHHDEYKWALAANVAYEMTDSIPHPFLARLLYQEFGGIFGYDYLRALPILGSFVLMALLYLYVRRWFGSPAALFALFAYGTSAYALLGAVQIDIDGVFLPLMALAAFMTYETWRRADMSSTKRSYGLVLALLCVVGFMFKLSFILVPTALVFHYIFVRMEGRAIPWRQAIGALIVSAIALATVLLLWKDAVFVKYVNNFTALEGRDYMQVVFQSVKAALFLAPLGVFGFVLGLRQRKELALWYIFLLLNVLFYFVVFDFTHRTFDRYLLFVVLPSSVITGVALARLTTRLSRKTMVTWNIVAVVTIGAFTAWMFALPHRILPLIPKSAFIDAILSGSVDFLIPMTGGSGPMGFYVPVNALAVLWVLSGLGLLMILVRPNLRAAGLTLLISSSLVHNGLVTFEYLSGGYYGSAPLVTASLIAQLPKDDRMVITYNDIGAYELHELGRYAGRFYPHAEFVERNSERLKEHRGLFLVVNMPELGEPYATFFASCVRVAESHDGKIRGMVLDCSG